MTVQKHVGPMPVVRGSGSDRLDKIRSIFGDDIECLPPGAPDIAKLLASLNAAPTQAPVRGPTLARDWVFAPAETVWGPWMFQSNGDGQFLVFTSQRFDAPGAGCCVPLHEIKAWAGVRKWLRQLDSKQSDWMMADDKADFEHAIRACWAARVPA